jgi:PAS domain S-box-containing protein
MDAPITVLHVDDDPDLADMVATFLEREDGRLTVETAGGGEEALERLDAGEFDCVVSDYDMPGMDGLEFLDAVREQFPEFPFVLYTGKGSEEIASEAISKGVTDYLQKSGGPDQYAVLANRIVNGVEAHRAVSHLEQRSRQDEALASLSQEALEGADLPSLLDRAVESVCDRLGTACAELLELEEETEGDRLRPVATSGRDGTLAASEPVALEGSLPGAALSAAEPVAAPDLTADDRFELAPPLADRGVVSGVAAVVGTADDPWGVLATYTTVRREFSPEDARFVRSVANVVGSTVRRRESEQRFREMTELSPDTVFRLDTDGRFTYASPSVEALLGYAPGDVLGTHFGEYVAEESLPAAAEGYSRVRDGEVVRGLEVSLEDAAGKPVEAELSASPVRDGGEVVVVQGFARDVTDRKAYERELRRLKRQYETVLENVPEQGIFLFDEDCRYTVAGGAELSAVGLSAADFEGATPHDLFPGDVADELAEYYRAALAGEEHTFEQQYRGSHYRIQTVPVRDDDGDVIAGLAVSQDVTERKRREEELERKNEQLEEFAGVVSHDLRNPLNVAQGRLELAREDCESPHLEGIETALERSQSLVDDVLALARTGRQVDATEAVSLAAVAERCWGTVPTGGARLVVETNRTLLADRGQLEQLFENLYRNCIEHSSASSRPGADDSVERGGPGEGTDDRDVAGLTVTVGPLADGFYVEDTGPGVPPECRDRIFEPGYSTSQGGTGFGLRIVERIVDAHGWTVAVTDGTDGGARVEVTDVETVR